jgi:S-adenosylmethionine hydrolase
MLPVIALLTDFGHLDPYVGQMKGALLCTAPETRIVDLCHEVRPHDIVQAGFMLRASFRHFPPGSVFLCVVDPGVGSGRGILMAELDGPPFLAPDNGVVCRRTCSRAVWGRVNDDPSGASRTFHGRDVFAGLAARLALGEQPTALGTKTDPAGIVRTRVAWADPHSPVLNCVVLHVDRFGNCLLNLEAGQDIPAGTWRLDDGRTVSRVSTYADLPPGRAGLLEGSQGVMELAVNCGSCSRLLGLAPGSALRLTRTDAPA